MIAPKTRMAKGTVELVSLQGCSLGPTGKRPFQALNPFRADRAGGDLSSACLFYMRARLRPVRFRGLMAVADPRCKKAGPEGPAV